MLFGYSFSSPYIGGAGPNLFIGGVNPHLLADMMKLVDISVLGADGLDRMGSNPVIRRKRVRSSVGRALGF